MPWLKWLIFQMPMSSPQRIRILGFFAGILAKPFSESNVVQKMADQSLAASIGIKLYSGRVPGAIQ